MVWIYVLILATWAFYVLFIKPLSIWKEKGIPYKNPIPIIGNMKNLLLGKESMYDISASLYNEFPNEKYNGVFMFTQPELIIRDIDVLKQLTVKEFNHFVDHRHTFDANWEPLLSKNLIQLQGNAWREMRAVLSPAFTANRMKSMFHLISEIAEQTANYFAEKNENNSEIELRDTFTRFTNDVIASCAFGFKCDSLKERNNEFFLMGTNVTNFTGWRSIKIMLANFTPRLVKTFRLRMLDKPITDYFINIITQTVKYRENNSIIRPDVLHLLIEARKGKLKHEENITVKDNGFAVVEESSIGKQNVAVRKTEMTNIDLAAQAFTFYFAGFDTTSTCLSFTCTELALNMNIQETLYNEICETMEKCNNVPSYDAILSMKYLDMVISESLRKWPPISMTARECTKDLKINVDDVMLSFKKGDRIMIPVLGFHRDKNYFPDPDKFDPERFSDENKNNIAPYSYLPFGIGPRACIGSRFALLEIKVLLVYLLHKFEFVKTSKTVDPIRLATNGIKIQPVGGFCVGLRKRTGATN